MSVQGGIWNFDGRPADRDFLAKVSQATAQYGPDGGDFYFKGPIATFYRAFHTTKESRLERQPYVSQRGHVLTWDGRLDNREALIPQLQTELTMERTDVAIVMAAYERWATDCFRKLIGDWSLALWNHDEQVLLLAKDFMGPRHLYYQLTRDQIFWCTHLEPMVLLAGHPFEINSEYIAGYLDHFPAAHLTPYIGIDSVPPGTFVQFRNSRPTTHTHWSFDPSKTIRYRTDAEYEEHFRAVFKQAVTRRLRSDSPVLAELSGGMDSSSIVCMADQIIAEGKAQTPRLDTISYYDDEEPNWDERPYFTKVEEKHGRPGTHIDVGKFQGFNPLARDYFAALPGASQRALEFEKELHACMEVQRNRVMLSGIGGDEVLGGVPTPIPELADLLSRFRLAEFASKLKAWSLTYKHPWSHLLVETFWNLVRRSIQSDNSGEDLRKIIWLDKTLLKVYKKSLANSRAIETRGCLPSQGAFLRVLARLANQLASTPPSLIVGREMRYPYSDRCLCAFLFSIPRGQILRPSQRRSLMRRSLTGIVPEEILARKRKAYTVRRIMTMYEEAWPRLQDCFNGSKSQEFHYVDESKFLQTVAAAIHGKLSSLPRLNRTIALELWLERLSSQELIRYSNVTARQLETCETARPVRVSTKSFATERFLRVS